MIISKVNLYGYPHCGSVMLHIYETLSIHNHNSFRLDYIHFEYDMKKVVFKHLLKY